MEAFNKYNCDNPEEINWVKLYDQLKPVLKFGENFCKA